MKDIFNKNIAKYHLLKGLSIQLSVNNISIL